VPRPRIGYAGSLHPQVDFGLVAELATRRPGWHFVFVGGRIDQKHELAERELEACRTLPNVHFLGHKGHDEIPAYLLNMDANIMCYRLAERTWVKAGYPLKLHEYLAAGAPIVSADLDSVRAFVPFVKIVAGTDQWEAALAEALAENAPELRAARKGVAAQNGWDVRARQLSSWLAEAVQHPQATGL
jgi:glycosyltransferase involved in cell wall biosynthesis